MDERNSPEDLEKDIGYTFKDKTLLEDALTRQSYINDNHIARKDCMDPLATVGDAILGALVVYRLYEKGSRDKGTLTTDKIRGVNRNRTRAFAEKFRLQQYIRWGKGEEKNQIWLQGPRPSTPHSRPSSVRYFLTPRGTEATGWPLSNRSWTGYSFFK